jgi:hypothetical protein
MAERMRTRAPTDPEVILREDVIAGARDVGDGRRQGARRIAPAGAQAPRRDGADHAGDGAPAREVLRQ